MADIERYKMESAAGWRETARNVPFIKLPEGLEFSPIPPFAGAAARFIVRKAGTGHTVSVYLDTDNSLGHYCDASGNPEPYWEVHPLDGDVGRCDMADTDSLVRMIVQSIWEQSREGQ